MKKIIFFCILFSGISSVLPAQKKLGAGIKAGINVATQVTPGEGENVDVKSLTGFHGGITVNYFIVDPVAIQIDVLISQKGSKWSDPVFSGKDKLSYLDIPVLVRFQPLGFLNVHAGPQFGFLLSATQHPDNGDKMDIMDYYKSTDIGLVLGAEGNLPFNINLTLRYILGLSTVDTEVYYDVDDWKNNVFQVSVGYRLMGR
jgi:hypothetical protein